MNTFRPSLRMLALSLLLAVQALMLHAADEKPARVLHYYPDGRDIVCHDGHNLYTRALYGTHTLWRLETSDRPLFATYNKQLSRNLRLWVSWHGHTLRLDSTTHCEARYRGGRRSYVLTDDRWGGDRLHLTVVASQCREAALFLFRTERAAGPEPTFCASLCPTRKQRMTRDGDLGMEPRSSFDADTSAAPLATCAWTAADVSCLIMTSTDSLQALHGTQAEQLFQQEEEALRQLTSALEMNTPDPFLNTLGANLAAAADGLWDGQTWLHGCNGWRTPLAGWRAAYVADVLGWWQRAESHFDAYAQSQVSTIPPTEPHPTQDQELHLARAAKRWGTQMYSDGYICRRPHDPHTMHHYDMNLNYIDELLWHFCHVADTAQIRRFWPVVKRHLSWEKRNFDPDGDHLFDAYCCIWASDALYYSGGAVTHSSAYNHRAFRLAARLAERLGEDPAPWQAEADAILAAMNSRLWLADEGHWAEYEDLMGLRRLHRSAALWTLYTPIDCDACSPQQARQAMAYARRHYARIPVRVRPPEAPTTAAQQRAYDWLGAVAGGLFTLPTSDWMPYDWSTNNVAHAEVLNAALAFFEAGDGETGYRLLLGDIVDGMYLGDSPGNFGQISYYDKARSEAYRDFGDCVGVAARALVAGLFGIRPDALNGRCVIRPAFPESWDSASIRTPYISYKYKRVRGRPQVYDVEQHFPQPLRIEIQLPENNRMEPAPIPQVEKTPDARTLGLRQPENKGRAGERPRLRHVDMSGCFNANVDDIFKNDYLSPRPPVTTLQLPRQGIGQWCHPQRTAVIDDSGLRLRATGGIFDTGLGVSFRTPQRGRNIAYTSLWDNYPDSLTVGLSGKARCAHLLLAGSTNNMQSRIENARVTVCYTDGTTDVMPLVNPLNWCPIEQEYYTDGLAFSTLEEKPWRVLLSTGDVTQTPSAVVGLGSYEGEPRQNGDSAEPRVIPGGAAQLLHMPLRPGKRLRSLTLRTLSNDVVVGLMAITLER